MYINKYNNTNKYNITNKFNNTNKYNNMNKIIPQILLEIFYKHQFLKNYIDIHSKHVLYKP